MFDGIDTIILPVPDVTELMTLYTEMYGFSVISDEPVRSKGWRDVWGLTELPTRTVLLGKPQSNGGWIRLVEVTGLPAATPAGRPDRVGPYALDFYHRDASATEAQIEAAGWIFRSPATHYFLPGTEIPVRERMLEQPISGLVHANVQYRPRGTRCVIDHDESEDSSEVVAVVIMTDKFEEANRFASEILLGSKYFEGVFDDPAVAEMLNLDPGEGFAAALFRGPKSRNARLEFAECMPGGTRSQDVVPRVILSCAMDDLEALQSRLEDGQHGTSTGIVTLQDAGGATRRIGFRSRYGAQFEFFERA